jgi:hypothetical protein
MSEPLTDYLSRFIGQEQQCGAGMPEVVKSDRRDLGTQEDRLERIPVQIGNAKVTALRSRRSPLDPES